MEAVADGTDGTGQVGVVVIGRNEGERLRRCLASVRRVEHRVYVDSGSTDGSPDAAAREGCVVVPLTAPPAFTAARARNAGVARLLARAPELRFVQVVDGDCELEPGWVRAGVEALLADPGLGAVFGRRSERFPDRSIFDALCDREWNVPVGDAGMFGGDVLFRAEALASTTGYPEDMIAGEDPDLSMRLRGAGWRIARIDAPMTRHDAAMLHGRQWWRRTMRGGHAFAELAARHPDSRRPDWRRQVRSILAWGGAFPLLVLAALAVGVAWRPALLVAGALALLWVAQVARIARRERGTGLSPRMAAASAFFLMAGKLAEMEGVARYRLNRRLHRPARLIEYKASVRGG